MEKTPTTMMKSMQLCFTQTPSNNTLLEIRAQTELEKIQFLLVIFLKLNKLKPYKKILKILNLKTFFEL